VRIRTPFLRARSVLSLHPWSCVVLRTVEAGEKRQISDRRLADRQSRSSMVRGKASRSLRQLVAARLLPEARSAPTP
jgi:hypothetical protein